MACVGWSMCSPCAVMGKCRHKYQCWVLVITWTSPATVWHHVLASPPFPPGSSEQETALYPRWLLPDPPHLPAVKGDGSGEISALARHSLSLGCPLSQRHSQGLCCQLLPESALDKEQGVPSPHLCSAPPTVPRYLGDTWGHPRVPVKVQSFAVAPPASGHPQDEDGGTGDMGSTAIPHGPAPLANKPQHQNFALRGKG